MEFEGSIKELMFPSPIYGASFKLIMETLNESWNRTFPSPIYGASFKLWSDAFNGYVRDGFRPLYTGLVSNKFI